MDKLTLSISEYFHSHLSVKILKNVLRNTQMKKKKNNNNNTPSEGKPCINKEENSNRNCSPELIGELQPLMSYFSFLKYRRKLRTNEKMKKRRGGGEKNTRNARITYIPDIPNPHKHDQLSPIERRKGMMKCIFPPEKKKKKGVVSSPKKTEPQKTYYLPKKKGNLIIHSPFFFFPLQKIGAESTPNDVTKRLSDQLNKNSRREHRDNNIKKRKYGGKGFLK
eukprot:TRINITY_DN1399_c1_g1_i1.p1 TRINITY_DN1399_c1_g1~~TRINITY_DN1399_c1_g1_i1.p1  ORF type:complete len:222 (-),score=9.00 TRINITY_DN1399_c1_g1_i1:18-683(-)